MLRKGVEAVGFSPGFCWFPRPAGQVAEPRLGLCALCQWCVSLHSGKGPCLNCGFGLGCSTVKSSPAWGIGPRSWV